MRASNLKSVAVVALIWIFSELAYSKQPPVRPFLKSIQTLLEYLRFIVSNYMLI